MLASEFASSSWSCSNAGDVCRRLGVLSRLWRQRLGFSLLGV